MRYKLFLAVLLIGCMSFLGRPAGKRIIFFGDSITEAGARAGGYIRLLDSLIRKKDLQYPELIGAGIGGNKVYDLYLRMEDDVFSKKPDVVVIWVGVNDVWHKRTSGTGTDPVKFERFYLALLRKLKSAGIQPVLCTPAVIGEQKDFVNELDGDLNRYSTLIRKMAAENGCPLVDLRRAFVEHIRNNNPDNRDRGILTTDGVHLNGAGNLFVARQMDEVLSKIY